jgi:septal ring factor EnvC (AmiA/AmiB activator)
MSRLPNVFGATGERLLAIEQRIDRQATRLDTQRAELERQREQLDAQQERLDRQRQRLRQQSVLHDEITATLAGLNVAQKVVEQQLSAVETRLHRLVEAGDHTAVDAPGDEQATARSLLEQVREEHRLIRVRFGAISRYEERLRRLEDAAETPAQSSGQT